MDKVKAGIVGCGVISDIYLSNCRSFELLEIIAVADLDLDRAKTRAEEFGVPKACSVDELLADPDIEIVINLTIPAAHKEICIAALEAGKHVYTEKPLTVRLEDAAEILELAERKGLRVGVAPDTVLGGGIQTCRKLIDDGWIGIPVAAAAFMMSPGPERWHPNPDFLYDIGGGPMFDMGPYYLSAFITLLGPITRVTGSAAVSFAERTITSEPRYGQRIPVKTPTHIAGVLDFASGAVGTLITSFDIRGGTSLPRIEIYGSKGTLSVPDPNTFGGPVLLRLAGKDSEWREIPLTHGYTENSRGIGVLDMAYAIRRGELHRTNGNIGYQVMEAMHGIHTAVAAQNFWQNFSRFLAKMRGVFGVPLSEYGTMKNPFSEVERVGML
ncbi:1,5-anhydro-D-fructose reductase [Paenibacillus konkukensis]|uniref:1,5-anhydro-D-fructose reductase n=1 Tax=Paenibacillus konkukensis TaxID=2020716 RepID=A0ABY4RME5_9BACL|nr:Gfo/Idh/MocA family oxidoreductase [Paenibacillus konkukensis]UQZ83343.1 1,5-anhydro-D-fructose reductase [Paenibacillus konkukensis]